MNSEIRWCLLSLPTEAWANQVFGNEGDAFKKLTESLSRCCMFKGNPVENLQKLNETLEKRCNYLNSLDIKYLHYTGPNTDLRIELSDAIWLGGAEEQKGTGIMFTANFPSYEVFTGPHRSGANGYVTGTKPLIVYGLTVEPGFCFHF